MDSQLTLADDSTLPDRYANTVLVFDQDSFLNATLRVRGGTMDVYAIRTERTGTRTELRMAGTEPGAEGALVVRIERNEILPDTIAFYDHPSVKISKWLKHRAFSVSTDSGPVRYVWKPLSRREIAITPSHR
ncbi:hypothetical protein OBBRIDRAFT_256284 [Obba rivulosa]|uniref:DUF6593 domain-containing protein n=1 Tax=Obba rivulosa TaxID=1052685 RepID=A0A8E2DGP0_9APHY|nr:hypothetical protein OBBRIDRAFT_256284 [Obba rivulosa]